MGVPIRVIEMAVPKAMSKNGLRGEDAEFSYMCGIVWKMIDDLQIDYSVTEDTAAVYTENEASERAIDGYEHGRESGRNQGHREIEQWIEDTDFLMHHIDGTSSALIDRFLRVA
jgi:hypothetical protein